MPHPSFDLGYWRKQLLTNSKGEIDESDARGMSGLFTDSPIALLGIEYYRELASSRGLDLGPRVPVDRFVFGRGEPPERHYTKIHGLPYRPRSLKWPMDEFGKPLTFLAQFSFVDSYDHIGPLPGDVFLIFIKNMYEHGCIRFVFEWHSLGIEDLVMTTPPPELEFPSCYGVRHRSWDFADESISAKALQTLIDLDRFKKDEGWIESILRALSCFRGMKIGGVPFWEKPSKIPEGTKTAGRFLCAFNGVNMVTDSPYPFVNEKKCLNSFDNLSDRDHFNFYDGLLLNFYLKENSEIEYFGQLP